MNDEETYLETRFYKKIKFQAARILSVLLLVIGIFVILALSNDYWIPTIVLIALFAIPIIASLKSTWFTLNPFDKRILTISKDYLKINTLTIPLAEVQSLKLYVHSFYGLRYEVKKKLLFGFPMVSEYGNKNKVSFIYKGELYEMVFLLAHAKAYLYAIHCGEYWAQQYNATIKIEDFDGMIQKYFRQQMW